MYRPRFATLIAPLIASALLAAAPAALAKKPSNPKHKTSAHRAAGPKAANAKGTPRKKGPVTYQGPAYAGNEVAMRFADEVAQRQGMPQEWVRQAVGQAQRLDVVQRLMQPAAPGARKNWAAYRGRFVEPRRIDAGVRFWQQNRDTLERAEREYGVPAEIIVGILGVETIYGQQMGDFRVIDALATLAFDHPKEHPRAADRSTYFRGELEQLLVLAHKAGGDPRGALGSYAGAMGLPQFMPSSVARWAVDFDGNGRLELRSSAADAIGSVANYFKTFNWRPGMPAFYPVRLEADAKMDALLAPDILPTFTPAGMAERGARLEGAALEHAGPLALVELQNGEAPSTYVAGTDNFYVITRYNQSSYYAMAVIELGRAVKDALPPAP